MTYKNKINNKINRKNEKIKTGIILYLSNVIIYGLGILMFNFVPYYNNYLMQKTQKYLLFLYISYLVLGPIYNFFFTTEHSTNKSYLFLQGIGRLIVKFPNYNVMRLNNNEKVAFLFMGVKLFFLPLMLNFLLQNFNSILNDPFPLWSYPFILTFIFTLDTAIFAFGYVFEARQLKNVVKSVEPTFLGWAVTLICYPPFNGFVGKYVPWGANDYVLFGNPTTTITFRILIIILFTIYVWASISLGTKASNLTNRGIVTKFPYSVVRHPAYISKNLVWWLTLLPVMNRYFALGMLFWTFIYFLRAVTEERHLRKDPDYVRYCKKVKYKFIPFIY